MTEAELIARQAKRLEELDTENQAYKSWMSDWESTNPQDELDYFSTRAAWKAACEWQRSVCNEELAMLHQRVAYLEGALDRRLRDLRMIQND